MNIQQNVSLKSYNTFGIGVNASHFLKVETVLQLQKALQLSVYPEKFVLSGGSNMLLTKDISALVLQIAIKGISIEKETNEFVHIKAMAGENWHNFVLWTLEQGYGGIENLSLIPGCVGTSPIQNIGAYGVELKDVFVACEAMHRETLELVEFSKEECNFGYRDSIFKNKVKNKYIITSVTFQLTKTNHITRTDYGAIENQLMKMGIHNPTINDISEAVIAIRQEKLPDPAIIGNSGSFFKNPVITKKKFDAFIKKFPKAPFYEVSENEFKIPAGWLIEQAGFKGKRFGDAGVHTKQALVLVNYANATGNEILDLSEKIKTEVKARFNIKLETEVNIIR
ncbi:UDP-N-acetylenolpyruvoylglucosamine reductase [Croceivirga lutea]|uniref:UDP-N-acetylmuramate dehydrogenase n=1 Tax=Croceivirga lutea TaxID=1775167 RepID=UPI00163AE2CE|nr:UDP-N-acetylmuramate dehydrogenase [Croceivirga lutea]GGG52676.1 UDP-N-acetylenolpyruvoylglucosamine reductase [Croceivirga lutea]